MPAFRSPVPHRGASSSLRFVLPLVFAQLAAALPLHAGDPPGRSIAAIVLDASGAVVPRATVVVTDVSTGQTRVLSTDGAGRARISDVAAARVRLTVTAPGFAPAEHDLDASATSADAVRITLTPAAVVDQVTVVSGSRQEELRERATSPVDVISRARMRDTGYESVGEVLREVPGLLTRRGSESSSAAGEQIQGIDSRGVLVLLDGLPIVGARGIKRGVLNLDRQSVGRLERVEVVKGASSALYGSDATGGVINLITRDVERPFEALTSLSGGTTDAFDARGEVGATRGTVSSYVTIERHQRGEYDLTPTTPDTTGASFSRHDALGKVTVQLQPDLRLTGLANGYWNRAEGQSLGELGPQRDDTRDDSQNVAAKADWQMSPALALEARGYHARYDETSTSALLAASTALEPGALYERYGRADATVRWLAGASHFVQGGVEWSTNDYRGRNRLRDDTGRSADTGVAWLQDQVSLANRVTATIGLRYDRHSVFGDAWSPKVGVNVRASDALRVRASYGRGFRAPDLGQLYYRFLNPTNQYQVVGNPSLDPERSHSIQAGADYAWRARRARIGVNVFRNEVDDLIESQSVGLATSPADLVALMAREGIHPAFQPQLFRLLFVYRNLANVRTQGVETDGELALPAGFSAGASYTYLRAEDRDTGLALTGRHPHQGFVRLAWETAALGGWRANIRGSFFSSWIAARAAGVDVDGDRFALWDLYLAKPVARGLECFGAVDNFTNSQDPATGAFGPTGAPAAIYRPEVGRTVRVGLRWSVGS